MNINEFQELLRRGLPYETPANVERSLAERLFGWSDKYYYLRGFGLVRKGERYAKRNQFTREIWADLSRRTIDVVEACGGRMSITGAENMTGVKGPVVYVANHMSLLETFVLPSVLLSFGDVTVVVKESLLRYAFFGPVMKCVEPITVARKNPREDFKRVIEEGPRVLGRGRSVLVFPQATRSAVFDVGSFNSLGVKLAAKGGVPIVPIALKTDFQGVGRVFRDFGRIDRKKKIFLNIGPVIGVQGTGREAHRKCVEFMKAKLSEWGVKITGDSPIDA